MYTANPLSASGAFRARSSPVPRGRIWARAVLMFGIVIVGYNVAGRAALGVMQRGAALMATNLGVDDVSSTRGGVLIDGEPIDLRLYWLISSLSLTALALFVFRPGLVRSLPATLLALVFAIGCYALQVVMAVYLTVLGHSWGGALSSGPLAWLLVLAEFMVAFLLQLAVMLSGRPAAEATH